MSNQVVRAIDVGYGNVKYTVDGSLDREIACQMFPSVAPVSTRTESSAEHMDKKDTVLVPVGSTLYEVGPDAMLGMSSNSSRTLDPDFVEKDSYLALMRGAMNRMGVDVIDYLVVGLPVSSMEAMQGKLEERARGVHEVGGGRKVLVKAVKVVPQPVGGMVDYAVRNMEIRNMQEGLTLLIDPGYFTLDWVVAQGMKMVNVRSGAALHAGMAAVVEAACERLKARIESRDGRPAYFTEGVVAKVDEALRTGGLVRLNGRQESVEDLRSAYAHVIDQGLSKLRARVGSLADIDRVILVGGAAKIYAGPVEAMFRGYDVRVAQDSVFSNVRGFQLIGMKEMGLLGAKREREAA